MPPGFMNAIWAPALVRVYASWASAITSPRALSPAVLLVLVMSAVIDPTTRLAIGATFVRYLSAIALAVGSTVSGLRTKLSFASGRGRALHAALVDEQHQRLHVVVTDQEVSVVVRGRDRVPEVHGLDACRVDDGRGALQGHADEAHPDAADALDLERRQDRQLGLLVGHVRGQVLELRAVVPVAVQAAVHRVAAAALDPLELGHTLVELVVANRADL